MRIQLLLVLVIVLRAVGAGAQTHPVGDLNGDYRVDFADLRIFSGSWLAEGCQGGGCEADLDGAGDVDLRDFAWLAESWNTDARTPVINEFMASNGSQLPLEEGEMLDADGDSSDWIELYNPTDAALALDGWYFTDDADDLTRWRFPEAVTLDAGGFLIVFASGKDRSSGELHTNFKLGAGGGYLALVRPDGRTVAHEYEPAYPEQISDISYGLGQYAVECVTSGSDASYRVPEAEDAGRDWTAVGFDDDGWHTGTASLGFSPTAQLLGQDIGNPSLPGGYTPQGAGYMLHAEGTDIWGTADSFYYFYMPLRGDGELTVFVMGMVGTDSWAKAGVMIRETLAPGSRHVMEVVTPGNGTAFQRRTTTGGSSVSNHGNGFGVPRWLRIVRRGSTFSGYYSADGVNWTQHGTEAVDMASDAYIGLCLTSHAPGKLGAAVFQNISFGSQTNNLLKERMWGVNASLWARTEFVAEEPAFFDTLRLQMRYEDGFVAYLNGVEVARDNCAGAPRWDSTAEVDRPDTLMGQPVVFDISDRKALMREGRNVLAVHGLNDNIGDETFLIAPELVAAGQVRVPQYFVTPTPGRANVSGALDIVARPELSHERGLYEAPFLLSMSCDTPGAAIRYTVDGTAPTASTGIIYTGPFTMASTMCLRIAAFKPGWMPSPLQTHTYIFPDQVVRQSSNPPGFPASWGDTDADYEMDPDIVASGAYRGQVKEALKALPTMSIVMDLDDLFGSNGIYANWNSSGANWERPCAVELIHPDGTEGFDVDCGIRIYGGVGRREKKKSFRLMFKREYGPTKLRYPLFGPDAADSFDQLILRANFNDAYVWGGDRSQYIRDEYVRRLQLALGDPSPHGTFVHLYINGVYWGLYNPTERPESAFAATYFGGDKEDWDALNSGRPLGDSTTATWNAMLSQVRQGVETNAGYQRLQGNNPDGTPNPDYVDYLDIDNYINYMILNFFVGNRDWPGHNWYAAMNHTDPTGWKSFSWDAEWVVGMNSGVNENRTSVNNSLCEPYARLRTNPEFCLKFGDQVHRTFFHDGPFYVDGANPQWDPSHPERNRPAALYAALADWVEPAMLGESARWGDIRGGSPYRIEQWRSQRDWVLNTYMPQRAGNVLEQLRDAGLYPTVDAPAFFVDGAAQHGGQIGSHSLLTMSAPKGAVYYTTDGTDPRLPAWMSDDNKIVTLLTEDAPKRVLVPSPANGGDALGNTPAGFDVTFYKASVSVGDLDTAEMVVASPLYRASSAREQASTINYFNTGGPGHFDDDRPFPGTAIGADVEDFVILATAKVLIPEAGAWTFGVNSDDGFRLTLTNGRQTYSSSYPNPRGPGDTLETFQIVEAGQYDLRLIFYERGGGSELELFAARGSRTSFSAGVFHLVGDIASGGLQVGEGNVWFTNYFDDSSWTAGTGGVGYEASGGAYPDYFDIDVLDQMHNLNGSCYIRIPFTVSGAEFANMMLKIRYDDGFVAYINGAEVARRNFTGDPAWDSTASGSNSDDAAVTLATIDISDHAGLLWEGTNLLAIHGLNTSVSSSDFLISAELVAGEISQGAVSPTAIAYTGSFALAQSTPVKARAFDGRWSALSEAVFAVGPVAENLRISEVMYHPADTGSPDDPNTEYVELVNVGTEAIDLNLVQFTNGIDFTFGSFELAPGDYCLVVKDVTAFEGKYGAGLNIAGRYSGSLNNAGERVELRDAVGAVIHDFRFEDNWFDITDGQGFSLTVKDPVTIEPGNLDSKSAWRPSANIDGSPGLDDASDIVELGAVVINELLANSVGGEPDWIELHNTTSQPIDLGGWFLSDDADILTKYEIAAGTVLPAGGYLVFDQDHHFDNRNDPGCHERFALSADGETVYLHSGAQGKLTGYSEQERFDASDPGVSLGRHLKSTGTYNFVRLSAPTPGAANAAPQVGPVVITEIMYHPPAIADAEYVELLNITDAPVTLYDALRDAPWRFTDDPDDPGIEFFFPSDPPVTLAPGEYLVLTKDADLLISKYAVPAAVQILAWGAGSLSNGSEKIQLSKPGDEDDDERHWLRVDRVVYSDGSHPDDFAAGVDPWPTEADGQGASLRRLDPAAYGNDPVNWIASTPSPGAP